LLFIRFFFLRLLLRFFSLSLGRSGIDSRSTRRRFSRGLVLLSFFLLFLFFLLFFLFGGLRNLGLELLRFGSRDLSL
jgi:hypothetical protein